MILSVTISKINTFFPRHNKLVLFLAKKNFRIAGALWGLDSPKYPDTLTKFCAAVTWNRKSLIIN